MIQHRRQQLVSKAKMTWQRGLEPDLCRLRYQCEDMERYLVVCYAARSANTRCKAGVLSVLSCVALNARLKRGPSDMLSEVQHGKARIGRVECPMWFCSCMLWFQPGKVVNGSVWWHQTHNKNFGFLCVFCASHPDRTIGRVGCLTKRSLD